MDNKHGLVFFTIIVWKPIVIIRFGASSENILFPPGYCCVSQAKTIFSRASVYWLPFYEITLELEEIAWLTRGVLVKLLLNLEMISKIKKNDNQTSKSSIIIFFVLLNSQVD